MAGSLGTIMGQVRLDVRQAVASYAALRAQNQRTVYALRGTGDSFVQAGKTMGAAGLGMVYAFGKVVNAAAEFERKMDYFGAVTDTNKQKMGELSKFTLQLAQDTIYSAGEIADGIVELGKAGLSAEQIMGGIGKAMANLGAAGDIPLAESGQIITSTVQQFDLAARDAVKVTDLLAGAANASIADITDIGVSLKYVGGVANAAGLTFEDTTTAISLLAKAGIRGSTAGTSLRQMIVSLPGVTGPAQNALQELGIILKDGTNLFYDQAGTLKPLAQVYQILKDHTEGLTQKQKLMYLRQIFNNRALSAAAILTRDGAKGFREMNAAMTKVKAADVAAARLDNLSGDIEILTGNIETLMVQAGSPFQEVLRGWVQSLTKLIQKFGELSPSTQKMIIQSIAISGAVLVAMGAISLIIGTIFRFAAAMLKLGAGIKFLFGLFKILITNLRWAASIFGGELAAALGISAGALLAIVGVVAAVAIGFVLLYKKVEPFRNLVNYIASSFMTGLKQIGSFFAGLPGMAVNAWNSLKSGTSSFISSFLGFFSNLGKTIWSALTGALSAVGNFISGVGNWFAQLPGRVLGTIRSFIATVTKLFTFRNIGYAIGFMIGTVVRLFMGFCIRLAALATRAYTSITNWFSKLPGRVASFITNMVAKGQALMTRFRAQLLAISAKIITGVINFFSKLPGRVNAFVTNMVAKGVNAFLNFAARARAAAAALVSGVVGFISSLPGRVMGFILSMVSRARTAFNNMRQAAVDAGRNIYNGIVNAIQGLPGAVGGVIGNMIAAFRNAISGAAAAVRDFAAGMWQGFKDGIGMHSPSNFERAAWQITGVLTEETKKMAKKTMEIQKLSKRLAATSFTVGDPGAPSGTSGYVKLARDQAANQNRARTLAAGAGSARARRASMHVQAQFPDGELELRISNWHHGQAYMRGLAQDVVDDNADYADTLEGMG